MPTFKLDNGNLLSAQKISSALADPEGHPGANGGGAVSWLFLAQDSSEQSIRLTEVYRIDTAGGSPSKNRDTVGSCDPGVTQFYVKYAAQYWLFQ